MVSNSRSGVKNKPHVKTLTKTIVKKKKIKATNVIKEKSLKTLKKKKLTDLKKKAIAAEKSVKNLKKLPKSKKVKVAKKPKKVAKKPKKVEAKCVSSPLPVEVEMKEISPKVESSAVGSDVTTKGESLVTLNSSGDVGNVKKELKKTVTMPSTSGVKKNPLKKTVKKTIAKKKIVKKKKLGAQSLVTLNSSGDDANEKKELKKMVTKQSSGVKKNPLKKTGKKTIAKKKNIEAVNGSKSLEKPLKIVQKKKLGAERLVTLNSSVDDGNEKKELEKAIPKSSSGVKKKPLKKTGAKTIAKKKNIKAVNDSNEKSKIFKEKKLGGLKKKGTAEVEGTKKRKKNTEKGVPVLPKIPRYILKDFKREEIIERESELVMDLFGDIMGADRWVKPTIQRTRKNPTKSRAPTVETKTKPTKSRAPTVETKTKPTKSRAPTVETKTKPPKSKAPTGETKTKPPKNKAPTGEAKTKPSKSKAPIGDTKTKPKKSKASKAIPNDPFDIHNIKVSRPRFNQAWVDDDDDAIRVKDVVSNMSRARGSRGFKEKSDKKYSKELRQKYMEVMGMDSIPGWAHIKNVPADDEDDNEMLKKSANYLSRKSYYLPKKSIEFKQMVDLNSTHTEGAIIQAMDFNANPQIGLVAGTLRSLGAASLFQVDGTDNHRIHSVRFPNYPITSAGFLRDGRRFVLGSDSFNYFYVYDMETSKEVKFFVNKKFEKGVRKNLNVSPDGKLLIYLGSRGKIYIYDSSTLSLIDTMEAPHPLTSATFTSNGTKMYTHGLTGEVCTWDMNTRECVHKFFDEGCIAGNAIAASPDNQYLACGSRSGIVNVYEAAKLMSGSFPSPVKVLSNLTTTITALTFNSTSEILAMGSNQLPNAVKLVHFPSMTVFENFPIIGRELKRSEGIKFSPQSGYLSVGDTAGAALLFKLDHYSSY